MSGVGVARGEKRVREELGFEPQRANSSFLEGRWRVHFGVLNITLTLKHLAKIWTCGLEEKVWSHRC